MIEDRLAHVIFYLIGIVFGILIGYAIKKDKK